MEIVMLLISSGLLTEALKFLFAKFGANVPKNALPLIAAIFAELQKQTLAGGDVGGIPLPDFSQISTMSALATGFAATGLHQAAFAHKYIKKSDGAPMTIKSVLPFLLPLMLLVSGCSLFQKSGTAAIESVDIRMKTDQGCQSLVIISSAIVEKKAFLDQLGEEAIVAQGTVQSLIRVLGQNCKG
jgi:hypothetical protein